MASSSTVLVDYSYLGQGRPVLADYSGQPGVQLTYYTSGGSGEAGDQYTGLDRFGRIVDQRWVQNTTDKERVKYGYDRASNRQWRQNTVAGTGQDEYYTYDGLYQVSTLKRGTLTGTPPSGISGTPNWEENWNYDPTGNWRGSSTAYLTKVAGSTTLNQNRTHNVANEITDITETTGTAWPTPTQDAAGNLTVVPRPLSLGNSFDLKWDAWNRLVEVKNTSGSVIATYRYDGATRRVTKYDGTNTRHYYYSDQWQVLEERLNSSSSADRRFVWGIRSLDDLILRDDTSQRLYALSDALGSVTAVVNTSGTVQERYGYDGFGQPRYMDGSFGARGSSSYGWETLFDGYRYDTESGLYQVRYRYLHPNLGRWLNRDPINELGFKLLVRSGGGFNRSEEANLFRFVSNDPISGIDPDGRSLMFPTGDLLQGAAENCCNLFSGRRTRNQALERGVRIGDETYGGNAYLHCVAACRANKACSGAKRFWDGRETSGTLDGDMNLANNAVGYGIQGDCWQGCADAWGRAISFL